MKKFLSMVLALTLLMSSLTALAAVVNPETLPETGVIFSDDFESYDVKTAGATIGKGWNYSGGCGGVVYAETDENKYYESGAIYGVLKSGKAVSTGKLKLEYRTYVPSNLPTGANSYMVTYGTTSWKPRYFPVNVVKTADGAVICFGDSDIHSSETGDTGNAPRVSNSAYVDISTDTWYKIDVYIDYDNHNIDFYVNDVKKASHKSNGKAIATANCSFVSWGFAVEKDGGVRIDDLKIERLAPEPAPLPDENILFEETFENYDYTGSVALSNNAALRAELAKKWNESTGGSDAWLTTEGNGNKYYYWGSGLKRKSTYPSDGKIEFSYKVYVPEHTVNGNYNSIVLWNADKGFYPFYVLKTESGVSIYVGTGHNTTEYSGFMPGPDCVDSCVKKDVSFGWHDLKLIIDHNAKTMTYYVDGEKIDHNGNATGTAPVSYTAMDYGFYIVNTTGSYIGIDDVVIRNIPVISASSTKISKKSSEITSADVSTIENGDVLTVDFETPSASTGNVVIAAYKGEQLQGIVSSINTLISKGSNSIALTADDKFKGADTIKAFIFSNFDNMYPMADAAVYTK